MGADLRHQEDLVATPFQTIAHPNFRLAAMILPAVVEEGDAAIDGFLHDADRGLLVSGVAQMVAAKTQS